MHCPKIQYKLVIGCLVIGSVIIRMFSFINVSPLYQKWACTVMISNNSQMKWKCKLNFRQRFTKTKMSELVFTDHVV
uniref:Uncharacterized protein n=1 Tax=Anguilla anguilla TaxID=7936 RepID=A0A0E9X6H9_ANGAN